MYVNIFEVFPAPLHRGGGCQEHNVRAISDRREKVKATFK